MNHRMVSFPAMLVLVSALMGLLIWGIAQSDSNPGGVGVNGDFGEVIVSKQIAPDLKLLTLDGNMMDLSELHGKVVMVDFWSSWCAPCLLEAPELADSYRDYESKGVEFLGVAIWDQEKNVRHYVEKFSLDYPNAVDTNGLAPISFGVRGIPEKYFIDKDGQLIRKFIGPMTSEILGDILDEQLANPS
jgi:cytochrome c biogenesis protein CcmG/thiol:disulfide interchange protein DsbE